MKVFTKFFLVMFIVFGLFGFASASVSLNDVSLKASVDMMNQFVDFRGVAKSDDSIVFQPSITADFYGFTGGVWGNFDPSQSIDDRARWNETDIFLRYMHEVLPNFSVGLGAKYRSMLNIDDQAEISAIQAYTLPWFTVSLTESREFLSDEGWFFTLGVNKNIPLCWYGMSLDLGASVSYLDLDDKQYIPRIRNDEYSNFNNGIVQAALNVPVYKDMVTVTPKIGVSFPLSDDAAEYIEYKSWDHESTHIIGGVGVSAKF